MPATAGGHGGTANAAPATTTAAAELENLLPLSVTYFCEPDGVSIHDIDYKPVPGSTTRRQQFKVGRVMHGAVAGTAGRWDLTLRYVAPSDVATGRA